MAAELRMSLALIQEFVWVESKIKDANPLLILGRLKQVEVV